MNRGVWTWLKIFGLTLVGLVVFVAVKLALTPNETKVAYETWMSEGTICFHGLVVDANGQPLPGARVEVRISHFRILSFVFGKTNDSYKRTLVTDENGRFSIEGKSGKSLGILKIEYPGLQFLYDRSGTHNTSYRFADLDLKGYTLDSYKCDPDRPAVFPMIRPGDSPVLWPSRGGDYVDSAGRIVEVGKPMKPRRPSVPFTDREVANDKPR